MFKNLFSKDGIWTTLTVLVQIILVILTMTGVFTGEEKENVLDAWQKLADAVQTGTFPAIAFGVVSLIQQILLATVKDPKKEKPALPEPAKVEPAKNGKK